MFPLRRSTSKVKKPKLGAKEAHTQHTSLGMGNNYGTGSKNPSGKMRSGSVGLRPVSKGKLGKPPKSVV